MKRPPPLQLYPFQEEGVSFLVETLTSKVYTTRDGDYTPFRAALLCDEMGIGKTVQTMSALTQPKLCEGRGDLPTLVVCPPNCIPVWASPEGDVQKWFGEEFDPPVTDVPSVTGGSRTILVISYATLQSAFKTFMQTRFAGGTLSDDQLYKLAQLYQVPGLGPGHRQDRTGLLYLNSRAGTRNQIRVPGKPGGGGLKDGRKRDAYIALMEQEWGCVVLDEVHYIKNPQSISTKAAGFLNARYRICLSGTPMMNHGGELLSVFRYGMNMLRMDFRDTGPYLRSIIDACTLGRRKRELEEIAATLPQREDTMVIIPWTGDVEARRAYRRYRDASVQALITFERSHRKEDSANALTCLHRLRQCCLHKDLPYSMIGAAAPIIEYPLHSPWVRERLIRLLWCVRKRFDIILPQNVAKYIRYWISSPAAMAAGEEIHPSLKMIAALRIIETSPKTLVYCGFRTFLEHMMQPWLSQLRIGNLLFSGGMTKREQRETLEQFHSDPSIRCLLVVKQAGAHGLNLQFAAAVCILMDPHFNSALDEQAAQRIDRIGQREDQVRIYRLCMEGSIDWAMYEMQERKREVVDRWIGKKKKPQLILEQASLFLKQYDTV